MIRWRETAREAWRNVASGTTHAVRWTIVLGVILAVLAWLDTSTVRTLVDDTAAYVTQGGATWIVEAPQSIDGRACDALSEAEGVLVSGAIRGEQTGLTTAVLPRAPIPLYSVTAGFMSLISSTSPTGVVVSDQVAARYGMTAPATLTTTVGEVSIGGTYPYPDDGRRSGLGFAALEPTIVDQVFDECWMTVWPSDEQTTILLYTSVIPGSAAQQNIKLAQLNPKFASSLNATTSYNNRLTRWAPVAAVVVGLVVGFAATWMRRLEHASALHTGIPRIFVLVTTLQETLAWTLAAAVLCLPVVALTAYPSVADTSHVALVGFRALLAGAVGPFFGASLACAAIREKHLFNIFKNR